MLNASLPIPTLTSHVFAFLKSRTRDKTAGNPLVPCGFTYTGNRKAFHGAIISPIFTFVKWIYSKFCPAYFTVRVFLLIVYRLFSAFLTAINNFFVELFVGKLLFPVKLRSAQFASFAVHFTLLFCIIIAFTVSVVNTANAVNYCADPSCVGAWIMTANGGDETDVSGHSETLTAVGTGLGTSADIPAGLTGTSRDFELSNGNYLYHADGGSTDITLPA
jgi:hypothetical protein